MRDNHEQNQLCFYLIVIAVYFHEKEVGAVAVWQRVFFSNLSPQP